PWARPAAPPCPQDRQEAEELWEVLKSHEPSMRRVFVEDSRRFQKWALCERLCAESIQALAGSVDEALELAELALLVAERTSGEESWCQRLQGYAWAHIANAHRARGDRPGAKEAFSHARQLWQAGAPSDPGLLEEARMLDLEAARGSYRIV
ncbi:MAG: hypothetical protein ABI163_14800, partial [Thermoanaerobaculia bacterium]